MVANGYGTSTLSIVEYCSAHTDWKGSVIPLPDFKVMVLLQFIAHVNNLCLNSGVGEPQRNVRIRFLHSVATREW